MELRKISTASAGSLLIELGIAVSIASISFTALASLMLVREQAVQNIILKREAIFASVSELEEIRAQTYENENKNIFSEKSISITPCILKYFASSKIAPYEVFIPNIALAKNLDGDCGGIVARFEPDFSQNPSMRSRELSAVPSAIDVFGGFTAVGSRAGADSSVELFDASNLNLHSKANIPSNVNALDMTRSKIFIGADGQKQFHVVDTSDKQKPETIASLSLPGVAGSYPNAMSVSYFNKKVYVGTHRTAGHEFHAYDVSSKIPVWLGSIELNHNINAIYAREPYIFLATSGNTHDLIILDASDPRNLKIANRYDIAGSEDALSIYGAGTTLYLGRKKSTAPDHPDFIILDISDPAHPKITASSALKETISGIRIVDRYAFLSTQNKSKAFLVLDISDKNNIAEKTHLSLESGAIALDAENGSIWLLTKTKLYEGIYAY